MAFNKKTSKDTGFSHLQFGGPKTTGNDSFPSIVTIVSDVLAEKVGMVVSIFSETLPSAVGKEGPPKVIHYIKRVIRGKTVTSYIMFVPIHSGWPVDGVEHPAALAVVFSRHRTAPLQGSFNHLCKVGRESGFSSDLEIVYVGNDQTILSNPHGLEGMAVTYDDDGFISVDRSSSYVDKKGNITRMYLNDFSPEHLKYLGTRYGKATKVVSKPAITYGASLAVKKQAKVVSESTRVPKTREAVVAKTVSMIVRDAKPALAMIGNSLFRTSGVFTLDDFNVLFPKTPFSGQTFNIDQVEEYVVNYSHERVIYVFVALKDRLSGDYYQNELRMSDKASSPVRPNNLADRLSNVAKKPLEQAPVVDVPEDEGDMVEDDIDEV